MEAIELTPEMQDWFKRYAGSDVFERRTRTINVRNTYDLDELSGSIPDVIAWLNAAVADTPEEYREGLKVEFSGGDYDDFSANCTVSYERPETDSEFAARMGGYVTAYRQSIEQDRRAYEALKKKFEEK